METLFSYMLLLYDGGTATWLQSDSIEKIVKPTTLVMTKNNHIKNESHIATLMP